jgi:hypothetical protein
MKKLCVDQPESENNEENRIFNGLENDRKNRLLTEEQIPFRKKPRKGSARAFFQKEFCN